MAFKLKSRATFTWPIEYRVPESGRLSKFTFNVEFRRPSTEELAECMRRWGAGEDDVSVLGELIVSWNGLQDENGAELEYSQGALKELLNEPGMSRVLIDTFLFALTESVRKNSNRPEPVG